MGEERLFRALRTLPDEITVMHSFRWVHPGNARLITRHFAAQGEGDFVLFDPARGILVVEVKGGEIWCEAGQWKQRNRRTGDVLTIFPEAQASDTMHRIRFEVVQKVSEASNFLFCHAVWFPDGVVNGGSLPMDYHSDMTFDAEDVSRPARAIDRAFSYWRSAVPNRRKLTPEQASAVFHALAPTFSIVRSMRQSFDEREEHLVQLTREQARILGFLDEQREAAITGAAGTGKTMLAIEKADRLSSPTEPVLFLCYNSALRRYLTRNHPHPNVSFLTFHGFARELIGPGGSLEEAEQMLLERLADGSSMPHTHVIIDEAHDFKRDWLEFLRYAFRNGAFYVFYDRYQAIQGDRDTAWLNDIPCRLVLTRNCRNTDPIARVAYRAGGLAISPTLGLGGPRPLLHTLEDIPSALKVLDALITRVCTKCNLPPHEIAVLTLETLDAASPWYRDRIGGYMVSETPEPKHVTMTTVRRFKGLEAALVIVIDAEFVRAVDQDWRRRLYVACSRARHAVHILTTTREQDLTEPLKEFGGTEKVRPSWRTLARHLGARLAGGEIDPFDERDAR
jgi:hypothetical protein